MAVPAVIKDGDFEASCAGFVRHVSSDKAITTQNQQLVPHLSLRKALIESIVAKTSQP